MVASISQCEGIRAMNQHVVEVTLENARQVLIEESMQRLVVVDFWADWCAPCKALMPVLEKLAAEYDGRLLLAKVNADQQPDIAAQFGIRSLPTVILMLDGQPVDAFQGAQPETEIRRILDKHLPQPWAGLLDEASRKLQVGDAEGALPLLRQAHELSGKAPDVTLVLAQVLIELNRCDEAETVLKGVPVSQHGPEYAQLQELLAERRANAGSPELKALEQEYAERPEDGELALRLGRQYRSEHRYEAALQTLLDLLRRDLGYGDGAARQEFLDTLNTLGKGDPLAARFQRQFFNLLY